MMALPLHAMFIFLVSSHPPASFLLIPPPGEGEGYHAASERYEASPWLTGEGEYAFPLIWLPWLWPHQDSNSRSPEEHFSVPGEILGALPPLYTVIIVILDFDTCLWCLCWTELRYIVTLTCISFPGSETRRFSNGTVNQARLCGRVPQRLHSAVNLLLLGSRSSRIFIFLGVYGATLRFVLDAKRW